MKTPLKIFLLAAALALLTACSAQRRAERHLRKAVALCPELVQLKAHLVDTVITAPGWADCATLPLADVLLYDTLYAATDHGTVVVSLRQSDSALRVGFVAAPQQVRYRDTLLYNEVVLQPAASGKRGGSAFAWALVAALAAFGAGMALCFHLLRNAMKR